jgi:hypothetical protein
MGLRLIIPRENPVWRQLPFSQENDHETKLEPAADNEAIVKQSDGSMN